METRKIIFLFIVFFLIFFFNCGEIDKINKNNEILIISFGDSITLGIGRGVGKEETYSYYLENLLKRSGKNVRVFRSGISGETTEGALGRIDNDIIKLKPDFVIIMYGTNDAFIDTCNDKSDISPRLPIEDYRNNMDRIIKKLFSEKIKPVLMTPILMGNLECVKYGIYKTKGANFKLKQYAEVLRKIAKKYNILLIDHFYHWNKLQKKNINIDAWLSDGVHPNREGNKFIAKTIYRVLKSEIKDQ